MLAAKAEAALGGLGRAVAVEETGLELAAMNGFPGPLVKWMLEAIGAEGIARAALALGNARARAVCLLAWTDGHRLIVGRGATDGELVLPPRGSNGFGWDPVFRPEGETRTYGELTDEEKDRIGHRGRAWRDLLAQLDRARRLRRRVVQPASSRRRASNASVRRSSSRRFPPFSITTSARSRRRVPSSCAARRALAVLSERPRAHGAAQADLGRRLDA